MAAFSTSPRSISGKVAIAETCPIGTGVGVSSGFGGLGVAVALGGFVGLGVARLLGQRRANRVSGPSVPKEQPTLSWRRER